jgi:hypothetical protein
VTVLEDADALRTVVKARATPASVATPDPLPGPDALGMALHSVLAELGTSRRARTAA